MTNSTTEQDDSAAFARRGARQAPPLRPTFHGIYLLVLGLMGLVHAAQVFIPGGDRLLGVHTLVALLALGVHVLWVTFLFRDAANEMGEALPIGPVRAMILAFISSILFFFWCAIAMRTVLRAGLTILQDRKSGPQAAMVMAFERSGGLLLCLGVVLLVEIVVLNQLEDYMVLRGRPEGVALVDVLGPLTGTLMAGLRIACVAFYMQYVARFASALYAAWPEIRAAQRVR